jgi:hypothetical protein
VSTTTTRRGLLATAVGRGGDGAVLAEVLAVAQLAAYCYAHVLTEERFSARVRAGVQHLAAQNRAHVAALRAAARRAGGHGPAAPSSDAEVNRTLSSQQVSQRLGQLRGVDDALELLLTVERLAVGACYAGLIELRTPAHARLVASIMASGGQHEALVGLLMHPGDVAGAIQYGLVQGLQ